MREISIAYSRGSEACVYGMGGGRFLEDGVW